MLSFCWFCVELTNHCPLAKLPHVPSVRQSIFNLHKKSHHPLPPCQVEIIDLTKDDKEGLIVGESEEPIGIHVEHNDTVVPETPGAKLVEIKGAGGLLLRLSGKQSGVL